MKHNEHGSHLVSRSIVAAGLLVAVAVPSVGTATEPGAQGAPATPATATSCAQSTVNLEIDVATGDIYYVDPTTGTLTLTDDELDVYFGSLGHVLLVIHYTSGEWNVSVTPDADPTVTYQTNNGWLRYSIDDDFEHYVFASSEASSTAAMNMTPVVADLDIKIKKHCPPSH